MTENFYIFDKDALTPRLQQQHSEMDGLPHLRAGDIIVYDFRDSSASPSIPQTCDNVKGLKVVQWNIERGYKLEGIIEELRRLDADVITLQELDISCQRTHYANVPLAIAKALGALCAFVCEFHELKSTNTCQRSLINEAGCEWAYHGNAIVTKRLSMHSIRALNHTAGVNWDTAGWLHKEPRIGSRYILTGCIDFGDEARVTRVQVYSLHLEIFCGPLTRLKQLADAVNDAKKCRKRFLEASHDTPDLPTRSANNSSMKNKALAQYSATPDSPFIDAPNYAAAADRHFGVIIGGDLNTIMHGIVRLSSKYSDDRMKWMSLGETEAEWLQRNVFDLPTRFTSMSWWARKVWWRYAYGLSPKYFDFLRNDEIMLFDAYDKLHDVTLDNPAYKGFVTAKLDWLLMSNLMVTAKDIGNHDYKLSDHKYLVNQIRLPPFISSKGIAALGEKPLEKDSTIEAYQAHPNRRSSVTTAATLAFAGLFLSVLVGLLMKISGKATV